MRFIAIDTETSGFATGRLIELAAQDIETDASFCEKIKIDCPIEPGASAVHGIRDEYLKACRSLSEVLSSFLDFVGSSPVTFVAHNAPFDRKILLHSLDTIQEVSSTIQSAQWICTMQMSKRRFQTKTPWGQPIKHTLKECCERANILQEQGHSALPDAIMCAKVQKDFLEQDLYAEALQQVREENPGF